MVWFDDRGRMRLCEAGISGYLDQPMKVCFSGFSGFEDKPMKICFSGINGFVLKEK